MNPWIPIIAQYGLEFAMELSRILREKGDPTPEDFEALKKRYTGRDWLAEAKARAEAASEKGGG